MFIISKKINKYDNKTRTFVGGHHPEWLYPHQILTWFLVKTIQFESNRTGIVGLV